MTQTLQSHAPLGAALRIVDDAWTEVRRSPFAQQQMGLPPTRLADVSLAEAERRSGVGRSLLARIESIDLSTLPHDVALSLRLVRFRAQTWAREAEWYWTVVDPLGVGFFGMFLPTAYCAGFLLNFIRGQLAGFRFSESGDCDRYLGLVADYARLIDQFAERTAGQAERGMCMPRVQVVQARALLSGVKASVRAALSVSPERLTGVSSAEFARELGHRIVTCIEPAFDRARAVLSENYLANAPETVGLGQYRGGREIYAELVKLHTTQDLTPEQVHACGLERMVEIEQSMQAIRTEVGFKGDGAAFMAQLNADPRWRATTVEGVTAVFQRYIDRLKPRFAQYFTTAPEASYSIEPLPEALQGSMTFGYYDSPRPERKQGLYLFNSGNLTKQALFNIGALTYHELVPGHHLHLATQMENPVLHPLRQCSFVNAYNEGWAEYAAAFAGEIGMYEQPEERYGRLLMDAFTTCRLVVDTGMNVLGWSLEQARDYMRAHSGMAEAEILTESVRYSCDLPGQALAYKLGDTYIYGLRERMRQALGARFDLKDFHAAVLGPGALPMRDLEWHVEHEIERLRQPPGADQHPSPREPESHLNLVIHEEARIECSAAHLWPYLLQPNRWKQGVVLEHAQGPRGARGEVFAALLTGAASPAYFVENVEVAPEERLTIKLLEGGHGALIGFASWSLREESGATTLIYDVYTRYVSPPDVNVPMSATERQRREDDSVTQIRRRFKEEFAALKRLAEEPTDGLTAETPAEQ